MAPIAAAFKYTHNIVNSDLEVNPMNISARGFSIAAIIGVALGCALPLAVVLSGSTFAQRCNKMFPSDPHRAGICVVNLAKGLHP